MNPLLCNNQITNVSLVTNFCVNGIVIFNRLYIRSFYTCITCDSTVCCNAVFRHFICACRQIMYGWFVTACKAKLCSFALISCRTAVIVVACGCFCSHDILSLAVFCIRQVIIDVRIICQCIAMVFPCFSDN